ncbi:MAG: hypothetical protein J0I49_32855 [Pseudonocardia sp.]|uniref:hypothetical protein n=1 Tax=Pseudonocardia sp. TaxID=60912 RepID=UPI001AD35E84|nr:hypothetical protein [Pseudonocardia sp.]MBN9102849.1 hypothetical protein [Pseudonocardia sp.]
MRWDAVLFDMDGTSSTPTPRRWARRRPRRLALQYDDLSDVVPTPGASDLLASLTSPRAVVTGADAARAAGRARRRRRCAGSTATSGPGASVS